MPPGVKCAVARAELRNATESARPSTAFEKASSLVRAGYLATIKTPIKIASSHAMFGASEEFAVRPLAATIDYLRALIEHATVHPELTVQQLREVPMPGLESIKIGAGGFREGLKKAVTILKTTVDPDRVRGDFDMHATHFQNPLVERAVNQVGAIHGAIYKPFWEWARAKSQYYQSYVQALHEGLKGDALQARARALNANPTDEMVLRSIEDANYAAFQDPTAVGQAISRFKSGLRDAGTSAKMRQQMPRTAAMVHQTGQALYLGSNVIMPFSQIPASLGAKFIDYSPIGIARTLLQQLPEASRSRAGLAFGVARGTVGSAGLFGLGYALAKAGKMTGSYPVDPKAQAQWQAEGKQENSIKIGSHWHNLQPLEPVLFMALLGANVEHAAEQGQSGANLAASGGVSMVKTLADQPYLMGIQQLGNALSDPEKEGPKLVSGMIPVPPLLAQTARGLDPQVRQVNGIGPRIQSQIPFLSKRLPPKLDQFGQPMRRPGSGLAAFLQQTVNPSTASTAHEDPVTQELDRLQVFPGMPSRAVTVGKQRVPLTPEQYNAELQEAGPILHRVLAQTMASAGYQQLPDEQKKLVLQKIMLDIRAAGTMATKGRLYQAGQLPVAAHHP